MTTWKCHGLVWNASTPHTLIDSSSEVEFSSLNIEDFQHLDHLLECGVLFHVWILQRLPNSLQLGTHDFVKVPVYVIGQNVVNKQLEQRDPAPLPPHGVLLLDLPVSVRGDNSHLLGDGLQLVHIVDPFLSFGSNLESFKHRAEVVDGKLESQLTERSVHLPLGADLVPD